jgi:hypothetical protein
LSSELQGEHLLRERPRNFASWFATCAVAGKGEDSRTATSPRAKTSDIVAVGLGSGVDEMVEEEEGSSSRRKCESTIKPPVLGERRRDQDFDDGFRGEGEDEEGGVDEGGRMAELVGKVCTEERADAMKGFIIRPVDQTHMPIPTSPSCK